jgi:hypothetical protein
MDKKREMLQSEQNVMYFHVSAAMMMIFKIKFEPTKEFNFEEGYKIIEFSYVNSISAQW